MPMIPGLTVRDIARKYDRPQRTIEYWRWRYPWPEPTGRSGRWNTYDPEAVDRAIRAILALPGEDQADPDELLDIRKAAAEAGITPGTLRSYISRGYWPDPDNCPAEDGVRLWKRSTVRARRKSARPSRRRQAAGD